MNVKITSMLIMSSMIMIAIFFILNHTNNNAILFCDGTINAHVKNEEGHFIDANVRITMKFSASGKSYAYQIGNVIDNEKTYRVNRFTILEFLNKDSKGYYTVNRLGISKNVTDDLPDVYTKLLMSSQNTVFYKINDLGDNIWSLQDLRRTVFFCKGR